MLVSMGVGKSRSTKEMKVNSIPTKTKNIFIRIYKIYMEFV